MPSEEPSLQVKCGGKILGPMTIVDVANLLAEGRISESDLVSEARGPWVTVECYVAGQSAPAESAGAAEIDSLFTDDFSIELDLGSAAAPAPSAPSRPPRGKKPASTPSAAPLPVDYGPAPRVVPLSDEEIVPLEHVEEKPLENLEALDEEEDEGDQGYRLSGGRAPAQRDERPAQPSSKKPSKSRGNKPKPSPKAGKASDDADAKGVPDEDTLLSAMQALAREGSHGAPTQDAPSRARPIPLRRGTGSDPAPPPGPGVAPPSTPSASSKVALPPGARPLFNGRDLSGWEVVKGSDLSEEDDDESVWSVSDGVLKYTGTSPQPHLMCLAELTDFELWVGWRALEEGSEGGLFLRSDAQGGGARCWLSLSANDAGRMLGANQSGSSAAPTLQKPVGEWNVWKIVAVGSRVGLWCNRQCAWSAAKLDTPRGRIGLRGDGTPFEYRFLHVRDVKRK